MKTPREILLTKHRDAEPELDAVRTKVLATLEHQHIERPSMNWLHIARELFALPRFAWAGVAAAWVIIVALHFSTADGSQHEAVVVAEHTPASQQALAEQRRLFVELVNSGTEPPPFVPRRRSEYTVRMEAA